MCLENHWSSFPDFLALTFATYPNILQSSTTKWLVGPLAHYAASYLQAFCLLFWVRLSWVLFLNVFHEAAIKMSARHGCSSETSPLLTFSLSWGLIVGHLPLFSPSAPSLTSVLSSVRIRTLQKQFLRLLFQVASGQVLLMGRSGRWLERWEGDRRLFLFIVDFREGVFGVSALALF